MKPYKKLFNEEVKYSQVKKAIENSKKKLEAKAKAKGLWENFGQKEVNKLKDRYDYTSLIYGSLEERQIASLLESFDEWCMNYTG